MDSMTIWHNPKCSKSRAALETLEAKNIDLSVVKYLETIPTKEDIKEVLQMLGFGARDLMRTKEELYKELNLASVEENDALIDAMVKYPKLIERPVIIKGNDAVIARPLENIEKLF